MPEIKEIINNQENNQPSVEVRKTTQDIVDLKQEAPIPREVKSWMEKLEEDPQINNQTQNNTNDDNALQSISPAVTKISLPTDRKTFTDGFAKPMDQAWRWLSEFVLRIVKQNQGRVKFKEE